MSIPRPYQVMQTMVHRGRDREGRIIETIIPAQLYKGESLGCCFFEPTNISVDETLRLLREHRRREREAVAAVPKLTLEQEVRGDSPRPPSNPHKLPSSD